MASASLYLHAVRAAQARQLAARLRRPLSRRRFPGGQAPPLAPPTRPCALWRSAAFEPRPLGGSGGERLRRFHAHYGDRVLDLARRGDARAALAEMLQWIEAHPPRPGDAWHPYTTSTRICNWIAATALEPDLATADVVASLWRQLRHLELNVEHDILGNHLIRNARALVLGGVAFGSARLDDRGRAILARELPEQVLPDGGHYERSPVYHQVVLRDLLEASLAAPGSVPDATIGRMQRFAADLARPDGVPALFNDGAVELAPPLELPAPSAGLAVFPDTGYAVVRRGPVWLAFDCGPPAPAFLPAHAHADALSFQLWWQGSPVVVDPGVSTYEPGSQREWERGTASHSTVSIDGDDQFTVWGAFRSGPLPQVELLDATPEVLAGRVRWRGGVTHTRRLTIGDRELLVEDTIAGGGDHRVTSSLLLADQRVRVEAAGGLDVRSQPGEYAERLFQRLPAHRLTQEARSALPLTMGWRILPGR